MGEGLKATVLSSRDSEDKIFTDSEGRSCGRQGPPLPSHTPYTEGGEGSDVVKRTTLQPAPKGETPLEARSYPLPTPMPTVAAISENPSPPNPEENQQLQVLLNSDLLFGFHWFVTLRHDSPGRGRAYICVQISLGLCLWPPLPLLQPKPSRDP